MAPPSTQQPIKLGRSSSWDPWLIILQIICLQCTYYTIFSAFLGLLGLLSGQPFNMDHVLGFSELWLDNFHGWVIITGYLLACISIARFMVLVVARAKLCLDFTATLHFFHLLISANYSTFPSSGLWWAVCIASIALMALLSEFWCLQRELEPIILSQQQPVGGRSTPNDDIALSLLNRAA